ncbi:NAC domain-containing protein 2-like [Vitis riparia]|uniref:NAC domain-containing protein 2-like n=1 Tax=Vitis riparia TaxID=96939 RepID=UPI00155A217D|nr:NAC domain-containing protein 2-like [Vitis riparia]
MNLLELGEDASLQTAPQEVQNNHSEYGKHFDLNSLPPGYRFNPTDAEIIVFYLRKKVDHQPLPPNKIIEVNLYAYDPEELAARYKPSGNGEWFYFTPRDKKYRNGQRPNRSVGGGYWKATGADKEIKFEDRTVGYRKVLVFYRGSAPKGVKTNWIMHEFRVAEPPPEPPRRTGVNDMRLDECVLCKVYKKDERVSKRSRHESGVDESGPSRSKIPRLDRNPNPNEANNQHTVGGGMDSGEDRNSYQYNQNINSHQALQNQQQLQQPIIQMPSANAVFSQDNLQVLPPAGTDVSFHGHNSNLMQSMEYPFPDHSWGMYSEFDNTGFASTMNLNPGYVTGVNIGNANLDSTTDYKMPSLNPIRSANFSSPRLW